MKDFLAALPGSRCTYYEHLFFNETDAREREDNVCRVRERESFSWLPCGNNVFVATRCVRARGRAELCLSSSVGPKASRLTT
jgi:hypothetical protein